jgi:hypothetical protein
MDALGTKCGSEYCDQVLSIQSGPAAIGCTKPQQAKEDVGNTNCKCILFLSHGMFADQLQGSLSCPVVCL